VGFPETDDDQRVFTSADVAALADAAGLLTAGMLDPDGLVELARPFGHLLSRLAAAQTSFLSDVLGARIAAGHLTEDPASGEQMAAQAVRITQELLPVLERTTVYVWRRHLAAEAGRALLPEATGWDERVADRRAAVGFIDISGYTRLSRHLDLTDVAVLLERFETVVGDTVLAHGGRVIKNLAMKCCS
jgi:adenylate cyclase